MNIPRVFHRVFHIFEENSVGFSPLGSAKTASDRAFSFVKPFLEYSFPISFPQFVENRVGCGIFYEVRPVRVSFACPLRRRQIMQHALGRTTDGRPYDRCISFFCRGAHCASVPKPPSGRGDAECNEAGGSKRKHHFSFGEVYALSFTRYAGAPSRREPKIEHEQADDRWSPLQSLLLVPP